MIFFDNRHYFLKPVGNIGECSFEIVNDKGVLVGTNIKGVDASFFPSDLVKEEFEALIENECLKVEARVAFSKEFNMPIEDWRTLNLSMVVIFDTMDDKYQVSASVLSELM